MKDILFSQYDDSQPMSLRERKKRLVQDWAGTLKVGLGCVFWDMEPVANLTKDQLFSIAQRHNRAKVRWKRLDCVQEQALLVLLLNSVFRKGSRIRKVFKLTGLFLCRCFQVGEE